MLIFLLTLFTHISLAATPREFYQKCIQNVDQFDPAKCPYKQEEVQALCQQPTYQADCLRLSEMFTARARQTEAKLHLSLAYTIEQTVFSDDNAYLTDLKKLFTEMKIEATQNYIYALNPNCPGASASSLEYSTKLTPLVTQHKDKILAALKSVKVECKDPKKGFVVVALGMVYPPSGLVDVWSIDEKKNLVALQNSTKVDIFSLAAPTVEQTPARPKMTPAQADAAMQRMRLHLKCRDNKTSERSENGKTWYRCTSDLQKSSYTMAMLKSNGLLCLGEMRDEKLHSYLRCYDQSVLRLEMFYQHGLPDGSEKVFDEKGRLRQQKRYEKNTLQGLYVEYDENESEIVRIFYRGGKKDGVETHFDPRTKKRLFSFTWEQDIPKSGLRYDENEKPKIIPPSELPAVIRSLETQRESVSGQVDT